LKVKRKLSLADVCTGTINWGVGAKIRKCFWSRYEEPSYWQITRFVPPIKKLKRHRIVVAEDFPNAGIKGIMPALSPEEKEKELFGVKVKKTRAKAYGLLTWRGNTDYQERRIDGVKKRGWEMIEKGDESSLPTFAPIIPTFSTKKKEFIKKDRG